MKLSWTLPNGDKVVHTGLVLSGTKLLKTESIFYAVMISKKNRHPEFTLQVDESQLSKPLPKISFFVTQLFASFHRDKIVDDYNISVKEPYLLQVISKVSRSIFSEL